MKRLVMAMVVLCAAHALAMPTQAELKKVQSLVAELMAPAMAKFTSAGAKEKTAAAVKVADTSVEFANAAETEAAKFLLLKGAVSFYTRGEAYDKAADTVTALQANVKNVTPEVIAEITGKATGSISETKAPRLFALYRSAKLQVRAASEAKSLAQKLKKVKSDALQRRYAEALAVSGDWKAAYTEFAKLSNVKLKAIVESEAEGKAKNVESGEFWWDYEPAMEDADDIFKAHAAAFYRKALAAGEITGLKKNIVEQRIKEYVGVAGGGVKSAPAETKSDENGLKDPKMFCVIDVAKGPNAKRYEVTYVDKEPNGGWTLEEKTKKIVLRKVKAGGDPLGRYRISKDYYIGVFEISQEQWESVMGSNPSEFKCGHHPVTMISIVDVRGVQGGNKIGKDGFAAALSERTDIGGFDLPTEAQWDYANRMGVVLKINDQIWERCRDNGSSLLGADPLGDTSGRAVANCKWKKNEQEVAHAGTNLTNPLGDRGFRIVLNVK